MQCPCRCARHYISERCKSSVMVNITDIHHASLLVADTARSLAFYCGVLGLTQDAARPDLGYPGAWLRVGTRQIHLIELPNPDPLTGRPAHVGRDRHTALHTTDMDELRRWSEWVSPTH